MRFMHTSAENLRANLRGGLRAIAMILAQMVELWPPGKGFWNESNRKCSENGGAEAPPFDACGLLLLEGLAVHQVRHLRVVMALQHVYEARTQRPAMPMWDRARGAWRGLRC